MQERSEVSVCVGLASGYNRQMRELVSETEKAEIAFLDETCCVGGAEDVSDVLGGRREGCQGCGDQFVGLVP